MSESLQEKLDHYRLSHEEYKIMCSSLGREPVGVEWALFSALWSEHCSYKSSKIHLRKFFSKADHVLEAEGENAGIIDLGQDEKIAFKMESHNHPSFIEPYQGAATGVGGILRDIFTMGARPIALANYLCFGELSADRMPSIVRGVVKGIGDYGNCVGVPTVTGQVEFHERYNENVLVNAMAVGIFEKDDPITLSKAEGVGNWVVYVGAKTGRDGIHGASMASESFDDDSESKRPTIQIGDPFYEKLLIESCLEVMKMGLVESIQDMGAAGLTSSSFEMASKGRVGMDLYLDKVPLRDSSMSAEDILLSESQERMLLVCRPENHAALLEVFSNWGLDATHIGEITASKKVRLHWHGEILADIDPDVLVENAPRYDRPYDSWTSKNRSESSVFQERPDREFLPKLLSGESGCNRDWVFQQYDQRVGLRTSQDASHSVAMLKLTQSGRFLSVATGCRPHVMRFDAKVGGYDSVAYPALQMACQGFRALAVTDCLNFGNPEKKETMTDFVAAVESMSDICEALNAPVVSGNVSFYNETKGRNITSTPATGLVGLAEKPTCADRVSESGLKIYVLRKEMVRFSGKVGEVHGHQTQGQGEFDTAAFASFVDQVHDFSSNAIAMRAVGKFGRAFQLFRFLKGVGFTANSCEWRDWIEESLYEVLVALPADQKVDPDQGFELLGKTGGTRFHLDEAWSWEMSELDSVYSGAFGQRLAEADLGR